MASLPLHHNRWLIREVIWINYEEIDDLQQSIPYVLNSLYAQDKVNENPRFDVLRDGFLMYQIRDELYRLIRQKRFQSNPYDKLLKVEFHLAKISCLYDITVQSRMNSLTRLRGNMEEVLKKYGYQFQEPEEVDELDALIEEIHRWEGDAETY